MPTPLITDLADSSVDPALDLLLRELLTLCFPNTPAFRERRYYHESPSHRWMIWDENKRVLAHVAVHKKQVFRGDQAISFGGIAEVCVHPEARGRGYVALLLDEAHAWMKAQGFPFALLYGDSRYYKSSGYVSIDNLYRDLPDEDGREVRKQTEWAMVLPLGSQPWPEGEIYLPGPAF